MAFDPRFEIEVTWQGAECARLLPSHTEPTWPTGYEYVGPLIANPAAAATATRDAIAASSNQLRIVAEMLAESNVFGLVAFKADTQTALVAIRGTRTPLEWIADFDAIAVPFLATPGAGLVHMGFQLVYEHIRRSMGDLLRRLSARRVLVTGHSLGAAVAVLAAFDIASNYDLPVELHSFAGPRIAAPDFANNFDRLIPTGFRVVNFMDVVPQVPFPPLFRHVGSEHLVDGGFRPLDVKYAHHLSTYLVGLYKLLS